MTAGDTMVTQMETRQMVAAVMAMAAAALTREVTVVMAKGAAVARGTRRGAGKALGRAQGAPGHWGAAMATASVAAQVLVMAE